MRRHGTRPHPLKALGLPVLLALGFVACDTGADEAEPLEEGAEDVEMEMGVGDFQGQTFTASLSPVNADLLDDSPSGQVEMAMQGDSLVISVEAQGLPPDMMHLQHFHGFEDGSPARCVGADADANGDGVIDVTETTSASGVTMVPFHGDPASLEIQAETYPQADAQGSYSYRQSISLESLRSAFQEQFGGDLALDQRVVYIHGVPVGTELPESAGSVLGVPAHVTLPIACGELETGETAGGM